MTITYTVDALAPDQGIKTFTRSPGSDHAFEACGRVGSDCDAALADARQRDDRLGGEEVDQCGFWPDGSVMRAACFGQGTLVSTLDGDLPIEWLLPGDPIITRDDGAQPLRALHRITITADDVAKTPALLPLEIKPGDVPGLAPYRSLFIARTHCVLLQDPALGVMFGSDDMICASGDLTDQRNGSWDQHDLTLYHLEFADPQLILAHGVWCESYRPDTTHKAPAQPVRPVLRRWEARLFLTQKSRPLPQTARAA